MDLAVSGLRDAAIIVFFVSRMLLFDQVVLIL